MVSSAATLGPAPLSLALRVLGVSGFAVVTGYAVLIARRGQRRPELSRSSIRLYGVAVLAMLVALPVGSLMLRNLEQPDLVLAWVVVVVGTHFLPLARVFAARIFVQPDGVAASAARDARAAPGPLNQRTTKPAATPVQGRHAAPRVNTSRPPSNPTASRVRASR